MASIPQLRKDINDLQEKLRTAQSRIAELEAKPPVVVKDYVQSPPEVRIVYRDKVVEVPGPERVVVKEVQVPGPERVVKVEVQGPERIVADPAQAEMIRKLQAKLRSLNADIL